MLQTRNQLLQKKRFKWEKIKSKVKINFQTTFARVYFVLQRVTIKLTFYI